MRKTINHLKWKQEHADANPLTAISDEEIKLAIDILTKHHESLISETGAWTLPNSEEHLFDAELAQALTNYLKENNIKTCVDFGCGNGAYVKHFNENGIETKGYDGNPHTFGLSNGTCGVLDLSKEHELVDSFDCVLSLEVGEHIPEKYEQTYIDNLCRHSNSLIVISWAVPGQEGYGHVNCKDNEYVRSEFQKRGFKSEMYSENIIRLTATHGWFRNTILIFSKDK